MSGTYVRALGLAGLIAATAATAPAQDATSVLAAAAKAMGADNLKTIQYSGMGSNAGIGQNVNPRTAWPVGRVKSYRREIDLGAGASHVQLVRVQNGAEQTQNQYASSSAPWDAQFSYWLTPYGFLKGAMANNATVKPETVDGTKFNVVTFTLQNKYKVVGYIDDKNLVERVQTWIDNDVLGDMPAEAWYGDFKDLSGMKFPTMIIEKQGGFPTLILVVSDVKPNAAVSIQAPPQAAPAAATQTASVQSEKVADGVYYLRGGTHHSVAVEFADHIAVIEAPQNEQRSLAVIAEVKKLIPNKPIRYLVNTHHHFDHSGGLRTYVDEGATVVTQEVNREFYEKALAAPRTLNPDRLAKSQKKATIETFGDKKVLSDGTRTLELYRIKDSPHNDGIVMAFLPKEKILVEADVYTPANAAGGNAPAAVNPATLNLVDNVEKAKLDFETILPLHGPGAVKRADLYAAVRKPVPSITEILSAQPVVAQAGRGGRGGRGGAAAAAVATAGNGKQILEKSCTSCHDLGRVEGKALTQAEWQSVVERMKTRGADVTEGDTVALVDYLVATYGKK